MPRRRSSAQRSGSMPVSARTRVDLPWSTWPGGGDHLHRASHRPDGREQRRRRRQVRRSAGRAGSCRARAVPITAGLCRRAAAGAQARRQRDRPAWQLQPGRAAAADRAGARHHLGRGGPASSARRAARSAAAARPGRRAGSAGRGRGPRRVASRAARVSLSTRSARASGLSAQRLDRLGAAEHQAGLRTAEQLVAAAGDQVGAGAQRAGHVRLVRQQRVRAQQAAADVDDHRDAEAGELMRPSTWRRSR